MGTGRDIVITSYGHGKTIDKIAISTFDSPDNRFCYRDNSDAETYCYALNSLELSGNTWVFAKIVTGNTPYTLDSFLPLKFDIFLELDDKTIQKVLNKVDSHDIKTALRGAKEALREKIFKNLSERAAQMIKEDMEYMMLVQENDVIASQKKFLDIIRHLENTGEIVISYTKGTTE